MDIVTLGAALKGAKSYTDATIAPLLGGVHYRGSVNYFNNLPSNPAEGDAYTVKYSGTSGTSPDGTEYVWALDTDDNTYKWIGFSPDTYTKTEVDSLLSGKQDTLVFEGTYNASTNKAATMSDIKDGKLTGYAKKTGNVAATDKVLDAIGKLETKADTNETNISLQQNAIADGGNGYALVNGTRVYVSSTEPTGTIPDGSIWIGG